MRWTVFILFLTPYIVLAQFSDEEQRQIDSLNQILNYDQYHDTVKALAYVEKASYYYLKFPDTAIALCTRSLELCNLHNLDAVRAKSYGWLGYLFNHQGKIVQALECYDNSLRIFEELGDKESAATILNSLGYIYTSQGDTENGLTYYFKSLKVQKELGNKIGIATALNNIGYANTKKGDEKQGLEYYLKSLKILEELGDKAKLAYSINNIGVIYKNQGNFEKGLEFFNRCLKLQKELGYNEGLATTYSNIGGVELAMGKLSIAEKSLSLGLKRARESGSPRHISALAKQLSALNKRQSNYGKALEMFELHIKMRDSIKNEETQKATIRQQTKYEFEKAQLVKEQKEKEAARIVAEETSRRDNLQYSVILIAILVLFGGVLALGFINVSERMAEGIIFFSFLILFEFLLLLADPYIDNWSGGGPGFKLLFNAGIAAFIFPLHSFFESRLKGRLVKPRNLPAGGR